MFRNKVNLNFTIYFHFRMQPKNLEWCPILISGISGSSTGNKNKKVPFSNLRPGSHPARCERDKTFKLIEFR